MLVLILFSSLWYFCKFSKILTTLEISSLFFIQAYVHNCCFPKFMVLIKEFEHFIKEGFMTKVFCCFVFPPCNQVTSGYKAKTIVTALPGSFLDPLLSPSLMEDYELRQLVLEVMHNLMDRHDNRAKLRGIRYWAILK